MQGLTGGSWHSTFWTQMGMVRSRSKNSSKDSTFKAGQRLRFLRLSQLGESGSVQTTATAVSSLGKLSRVQLGPFHSLYGNPRCGRIGFIRGATVSRSVQTLLSVAWTLTSMAKYLAWNSWQTTRLTFALRPSPQQTRVAESRGVVLEMLQVEKVLMEQDPTPHHSPQVLFTWCLTPVTLGLLRRGVMMLVGLGDGFHRWAFILEATRSP